MSQPMVILVGGDSGMKFYDKHFHINIYLERFDDIRVPVKTQLTDYLPRTIKVDLPTDGTPDATTAAAAKKVLYLLYAELVDSVDPTDRRMIGRCPFSNSNFGRLFSISMKDPNAPTTSSPSKGEKRKK